MNAGDVQTVNSDGILLSVVTLEIANLPNTWTPNTPTPPPTPPPEDDCECCDELQSQIDSLTAQVNSNAGDITTLHTEMDTHTHDASGAADHHHTAHHYHNVSGSVTTTTKGPYLNDGVNAQWIEEADHLQTSDNIE